MIYQGSPFVTAFVLGGEEQRSVEIPAYILCTLRIRLRIMCISQEFLCSKDSTF